MVEIRFECPLSLPEGWLITPVGQKSNQHNFAQSMTMTEAVTYLYEEAQQLDVGLVKIYSNFQQLNNERSRKQIAQGNGFAIEVKFPSGVAHLACDKWMAAEHNAYALSLALRNLRQFEKWGIATTEFMFTPFMPRLQLKGGDFSAHAAHEAGGVELPEWMTALGLGPTSTIEDANAIYRRRAKLLANDEQALLELNTAMDAARKRLS